MSSNTTPLGFVMLIDDSKIDNYINTKVLEMTGRTNSIKAFDSASEAIEFLQFTKEYPDLIFLDLYMPTMDGFDFLEEFQKLFMDKKKIKVILLSGAYDTPEVERLKKYDWISGYLVKPLTYEALNAEPMLLL